MPHRELLTESQRLSLQAPASDERGMVRHYALSSEDLALINRRRGDPNRLGFALTLCYLRFPGRILQQGEQPPAALCAFVAEQLGLDAAHFGDYAERDQTRREHVLEIETALGLCPLTRVLYRELAASQDNLSVRTTRPQGTGIEGLILMFWHYLAAVSAIRAG